jgi:hypothetical protein
VKSLEFLVDVVLQELWVSESSIFRRTAKFIALWVIQALEI